MRLTDLKIAIKIYLGFSIILIIFMGSSGYLIRQIDQLGELNNVGVKRASDVLDIKDITSRVESSYTVMADAIINRDLNFTRERFAIFKANATKDIKQILVLVDTPEEQALAKIFADQYRNYFKLLPDSQLSDLNLR